MILIELLEVVIRTKDSLMIKLYRKNSVYPLSGIGAWQLRKWVCAMVPRDRVIGNDAKISSFERQFSCCREYEGRVNCRPSKTKHVLLVLIFYKFYKLIILIMYICPLI